MLRPGVPVQVRPCDFPGGDLEARRISVQQEMRFGSIVIGSDVTSHLIQAGLSGTEWSLVLAVIQQMSRKGEMAIFVSLREFHELVGLAQEAIRKGLKTLREKNILIRHEAPSFTTPASWSFNDDWQSWVTSTSGSVLRQHTPPPQHTESPMPEQRRVLSEHTVFASA